MSEGFKLSTPFLFIEPTYSVGFFHTQFYKNYSSPLSTIFALTI